MKENNSHVSIKYQQITAISIQKYLKRPERMLENKSNELLNILLCQLFNIWYGIRHSRYIIPADRQQHLVYMTE